MITTENYEEWMMLAADGELDAAGREALDAFLAAHPELEPEAAAWESLHLQPDATMVYAEKEVLLRREPKRLAFGWNALAAAAAVLAAIILIPQLLPHRQGVQVVHRFHHQTPTDTEPAHMPSHDTVLQLAHLSELVRKRHAKPEAATVPVLASWNVSDIALLPANGLQPLPIASVGLPTVAIVVAEARNSDQHSEREDAGQPERAFPRIRLAEANQPALGLLKRGVTERIAQAADAARRLRETSFAVQIGNKAHYLNF